MREQRAGVTVERVVVWAVAALAVAGTAAVVVGPGADLRGAAPEVAVDATFDADAGAVTLEHAGGDSLTAGNTDRLVLELTDADRNTTVRVAWASGDRLPIEPGDTLVVDDPRVDSDGDGNYLDGDRSVGFYLEPGDRITVVWTGRLPGAPQTRTVTVADVTV